MSTGKGRFCLLLPLLAKVRRAAARNTLISLLRRQLHPYPLCRVATSPPSVTSQKHELMAMVFWLMERMQGAKRIVDRGSRPSRGKPLDNPSVSFADSRA